MRDIVTGKRRGGEMKKLLREAQTVSWEETGREGWWVYGRERDRG